ncbi:hypothetical protein LLH03_21485 [bacterium]|nr:hypothetical protein [bacterium]
MAHKKGAATMRDWPVCLSLALLVICVLPCRAALKVLDRPLWVFPGQTFRVALEQPPQSGELKVVVPAELDLFDRWPKDTVQRFYFRALKPGELTLHFEGAGGQLDLPVSVLPWSSVYETRDWEGIKLPRLWPVGDAGYSELKQRRTLHTEAQMQRLRDSKAPASGRASAWLAMSDDEVFNVIPGPCVPRTCLMVLSSGEAPRGKGCPVCGTKIYEGRSGFYPWIFDAKNHPWKVGCPSCGNWFPSNDFQKGDMHSGDFPDDGFGCEPVSPVISPTGVPWRYPFVAYYHEWEAYMRTFTPAVVDCAQAAVTTGDKRYAHKAAIALFRFAESQLDMALNLNHRKMAVRDAILRGPVGAPETVRMKGLSGSFLYIQPNWDTPRMEEAAQAWDLIFDLLDGDAELVRFCQTHYHPEIKSLEDFRRFIEAGVHRVTAQACLDNAVSRNWPMQETTLATVALGMGTPRGLDLIDWLLNTNGIRYALTNEYFKDGAGHESEGYNGIQIGDMTRLILLLDRVAQVYPDLYKAPRFVSLARDPKFRRLYDFPLDDSLIGRTYPSAGDTGGAGRPSIPAPQQGYPLVPGSFAEIFSLTRDPKFAQALWGPKGEVPSQVQDPALRAEVEKVGKERGWQVQQTSDILDGFGHAILRSGTGDRQRALWMRYGRTLQHAHPDMLTMGFEAMQRKLLPELGYPVGWTYAGSWETNWGTHYVTHVDKYSTRDFGRGKLTSFADSAPARVAIAESQLMGEATPRPKRERLIALVDIDDRDCYGVTLERVFGGETQYWSFHGPDGEATLQGVSMTPQATGTLAGPDSKYGDDTEIRKVHPDLSCFAFLYDVARGTPTGPWSLDYALRDQTDLGLRLTCVSPSGGKLATAKGKAPGGKSNYEITWAVWQQQGKAPLASQFLSVLEPYEKQSRLGRVVPVRVTGTPVDGFEPLAIRVEGTGFTDTFVFQRTGGGLCRTEDGLETDALYAFWRERNGKPETAVLLGGTFLRKAGMALRQATGECTGKIESCDWGHSTLRVRFAGLAPAPEALVGRQVRLRNDDGSDASYLVKAARADGPLVEIKLGLDPRIGEGSVAGVDDGAVTSAISLRMAPWQYYAGKTLANEDGSALYRLKDVTGSTKCVLVEATEKAKLAEAFSDRDGDGLVRFVIYDYGPGDEVRVPCWTAGAPSAQ